MRLIKMLGLAATAALVVMAFVGASSAMAEKTELCKNKTETCEPVTHVHFLSVNSTGATDGKGQLLSGSNTVECELLVLGEVVAGTSNPVEILADAHYTNCNLGCSVKSGSGELETHGVIDVLRLGSEELADIIALKFAVKLSCPFIFSCDYSTGTGLTAHGLPFGAEGKGHSTYTKSSVTLVEKLSGPFKCPEESALDALLQSLTPIYVR